MDLVYRIKRKIAKSLDPYVYVNEHQVSRERSALEKELDKIKNGFDLIRSLLLKYELIAIENSKSGEELLIVQYDHGWEGYREYGTHKLELKMFDLKYGRDLLTMDICVKPYAEKIFIIDFKSGYEDRGNGSAAMRSLFTIAHRLGINRISGDLSSVDWGHIDKLKYFYEKHDFNVSIDYDKKEGRIEWIRRRT